MIWIRILIIFLGIIAVIIGTYAIHWLLNGKEWVEVYIKKVRLDLLKKYPPGSRRAALRKKLVKRKVIAKTLSLRDKFIAFLAEDKPKVAISFIYILMTSFLLLSLFALFYLMSWWIDLSFEDL